MGPERSFRSLSLHAGFHLLLTGATDVLLLVLATISGILIARLLGPVGRGEYAIALLWPSVLVAIGSLGLREALTYELATATSTRATLTGHALLLALGQSLLLILLGFVLIPILTRGQTPEVMRSALVYLWFIPANLLTTYALGLLQGDLALSVFNAVRLSVNVVFLVVVLLLWALGRMTVWNLTLGFLIANFAAALLAVIVVLARYSATWKIDKTLTRRLFAYGIRNHAGSISLLLNQRMDQMLMAVLLLPCNSGGIRRP